MASYKGADRSNYHLCRDGIAGETSAGAPATYADQAGKRRFAQLGFAIALNLYPHRHVSGVGDREVDRRAMGRMV